MKSSFRNEELTGKRDEEILIALLSCISERRPRKRFLS